MLFFVWDIYFLKITLGSKSGTRETSQEAIVITQAGDCDGVDKGGVVERDRSRLIRIYFGGRA